MFSKLNINTENIAEKLKNFKDQFFKSEGVRIGIPVFLGLILLLFILPFFLNNDALKFQITQKISQTSGGNLTISGDVKVALLPSPTITLENVLLQNYKPKTSHKKDQKDEKKSERVYNIFAKKVQIKFPVFRFSDDLFIKKITFIDAVLESYDNANPPVERKNKFTAAADEITKNNPAKEVKKIDSGLSAKFFSISDVDPAELKISGIPYVVIENGETLIYDRLGRLKEIEAINTKTKISEKKISGEGNFSSEKITSNFKFLVKFNSQASKPDSFLEVVSPVLEMNVKGNFTSANNNIFESDFKGKIEAEILELKSFYKSYISSASVISGKLKYNAKPIKISAEIDNKSKEVSIKNILVNSSLVNGKGEAVFSFASVIPLIDIDLDLDDLDLDNVWSGEAVAVGSEDKNQKIETITGDEAVETLPPVADKPAEQPASQVVNAAPDQQIKTSVIIKESPKIEPINFNITEKIKDFDLTAEIKIKSIKYFEGEIKDASIYLTVSKEGEILILPMIFRIPGEGSFRVNGVLDNTAQLPKFVGKFDANGKSLKDVFKWLKIESQNLKFDNLKEYNLYSDVLLLPNSVTMNNFYLNLNNGQSEFLGELKIDNSNKTPNITSRFQANNFNVDDYFLTSGQNIYFSPGSLLKKFLWLNEISSDNDINLKFDKMTYKGEEFSDQSLKLKFGRGYFEIADLNLNSVATKLKASLAVDISGQNPKFDMNIVADNFHYEAVQKEVAPAETIALEGGKAIAKKIKKQNFFDQFFALPSLEGFGGKVVLDVGKLKLDDLEIQDVKFAGKLKDGNFDNSELTCGIYGGSLSYKGQIGIKINKIVNGNLTFNNASLQPLLSDLIEVNNVSGVANISANLTASAVKRDEFAKELTSEIKFSANAPTVAGYGLSDLVRKMFAVQTYRQELSDPDKILFNPQAKTTFKQASGTIQINSGKDGRLRINTTAPAINGILSGTINAANNSVEALFNAIFLTGTRQKQTPINIATGFKGSLDNISQSTNLDQVRQYLGLKPKQVEAAPKSQDQDLSPERNIAAPQDKPMPLSQFGQQAAPQEKPAPAQPAADSSAPAAQQPAADQTTPTEQYPYIQSNVPQPTPAQ